MAELLEAPKQASYAQDYVDLRPQLESLFRKRFPTLRGQESDFYNDAWESLLRSVTIPESTFAYLERALYTRGLNEVRRRGRRPADKADPRQAVKVERVIERTEQGTEEAVVGELGAATTQQLLLEHLSARQARIIKLHYGWGLTVPEVAAALSLSRRTVRREVEEAAPKILENADWLRPCAGGGRRSLVRAYVLGFLSDGRAAKAAAHLDECPSCRALRDQMEEALRSVAAAVPVGLIAAPPAAEHSLLERIAHTAEAFREQVADVAGSAKEQAAAIGSRTPGGDAASQVAAGGGLRGSGAMLATAASCLVVGGGTVTYCAVEGVPEPIRDVIPGVEKAASDKPKEQAESDRQPVEGPAHPAPPVVPTVSPLPAASPPDSGGSSGEPHTRSSAPEPPPPQAAEQEFGIEQTAAPSAGDSAASAPSRPSPPPAPSGGTEEFGFER